jgi:hypothetical protein
MDAASALQTTGDRSEAKNQIDALRQEIKTKQSDIRNLEANLAKEAEAYYAPQIDDLKGLFTSREHYAGSRHHCLRIRGRSIAVQQQNQ